MLEASDSGSVPEVLNVENWHQTECEFGVKEEIWTYNEAQSFGKSIQIDAGEGKHRREIPEVQSRAEESESDNSQWPSFSDAIRLWLKPRWRYEGGKTWCLCGDKKQFLEKWEWGRIPWSIASLKDETAVVSSVSTPRQCHHTQVHNHLEWESRWCSKGTRYKSLLD